MVRIKLKDKIGQGLFLLDGAMGTQLFSHGVDTSKCNDYLNIESPDVVLDVHQAYLQAGSDAILTNTFGANKYALARHGFSELVEKINAAAAQIARRAAGDKKYVLGDIGPTGDFLEPLGKLKSDELKAALSDQAQTLLAGGVDGFIIETMTDIEELAIAVEAVKSISADLPVFATMAFDSAGEDFKTMMGVGVEALVSRAVSLGVDAVGFNCGCVSLESYIKLADRFIVAAAGHNIMVLAEPNAGLPDLVDGEAVYNVTPDDYAQAAEKIHVAGVTIIGGCCGTSPAHIKAVSKRLK
jgi:5-methyltetrahydrofolate--homocysteine methyltransferase